MSELDNPHKYDPLTDMGALDEANRIQELESDKKKKINEAQKVAERIAAGEKVNPEAMESFNATKEELLSEPVIEESKTEPISAEDIAVAAKVLGEEQEVVSSKDILTPEEELRMSAFRTKANEFNKMPTLEEEATERARIISERSKNLENTSLQGVGVSSNDDDIPRVYGEPVDFTPRDNRGSRTPSVPGVGGPRTGPTHGMPPTGERSVPRPEAEDVGPELFTEEEKARIIKQAYDAVFIDGAYGRANVYQTFFGDLGFLRTKLGKAKDDSGRTSLEVTQIIDKLEIDNWIAVRENIKSWNGLANKEEVTPSVLTESLFLPDEVESFFAQDLSSPDGKRYCQIPEPHPDGRIEILNVEMESAVSDAMKRIKGFFDGTWAPNPVDLAGPGVSGNGERSEYWGYVGADVVQKAALYKSLGINKYVGEVAFSTLLSHNMLTETSSDDIFLMMVDSATKRPGNYRVNEARDPFVRMRVQEVRSSGGSMPTKEELSNWVAKKLPRHMIPTGLTGNGRAALSSGHWLQWRVNEDMYSYSNRITDVAAGVVDAKPATDPAARLVLMRDALDVLMAIKEVANPTSDLDKLEGIMSKVLKWARADLAGVGWAKAEPGGRKIINKEFCLEDENGNTSDTESFDWGGKIMLTLAEAFLYTHSFADRENKKPWDLDTFGEKAKEILSLEVQSEKGTYIGLSLNKENKISEKVEYIKFVDRLWKDMKSLCNATSVVNQTIRGLFSLSPSAPTIKLPQWYSTKVPLSPDILKILMSGTTSTSWPDLRNKIEL